jgi:hypothetical protein
MTMNNDVRHWHGQMDLPGMEDTPCIPDESSRRLGYRLVQEEHQEFLSAILAVERIAQSGGTADDVIRSLGEMVKEALDLVWVVLALLHRYGIPIDECWSELVASNGSKTPGLLGDGGKLTKGPDYKPADMVRVIREAMER